MAPLFSTPDDSSGHHAVGPEFISQHGPGHHLPSWWLGAVESNAIPGDVLVFAGDLQRGWIAVASALPDGRTYVEVIGHVAPTAVENKVLELVVKHHGSATLFTEVSNAVLVWFHRHGREGLVVHRGARLFPVDALAVAARLASAARAPRSPDLGGAQGGSGAGSHGGAGSDQQLESLGAGTDLDDLSRPVSGDAFHSCADSTSVSGRDGVDDAGVDDLGEARVDAHPSTLEQGESTCASTRSRGAEQVPAGQTIHIHIGSPVADPPQATLLRIWESKILAGGDQS